MKRSKFLVPLSWEHHSALVNANRIKLGVENKGKVEDIRKFIEYIWQHDLLPHFTREETIILNHQEAVKIAQTIKERTLNEHSEFLQIFNQIMQSQLNSGQYELFKRFAVLLVSHVRFEESEFFPAVEKRFSKEALEIIGKKLKEQHVPGCITWQPAFWRK